MKLIVINYNSEQCRLCPLVENKAVNFETCEGCMTGCIDDPTVYKRVGFPAEQLKLF